MFRKTGWTGMFTRVFGVLEDQTLSFYESIDQTTHLFKGFKGAIQLKDGNLTTLRDGLRKYCIKVSCAANGLNRSGTNVETIDCGDPKSCTMWANTLNKAFKLHSTQEEEDGFLKKNLALLQLPDEGILTKAMITRNYKRVCLQHHPDKGGDATHFNDMVAAYKWLLSYHEEQERLLRTKVIDYDVVLERGPKGMGFSVNEDKMKKGIYITDVHKDIKVIGMTAEAGNEIRIDDKLIGVDKDDCSKWPISRLRARLSAARVPVGSQVTFLIERRIDPEEEKKIEEPSANPESAPRSPSPSVPMSPSSFYQGGRSPMPDNTQPFPGGDESTHEVPSPPSNSPSPSRNTTKSGSSPRHSQGLKEDSELIKSLQEELELIKLKKNDEINGLQHEIHELRKELSRTQKENKKLKIASQANSARETEIGRVLAQNRRILKTLLVDTKETGNGNGKGNGKRKDSPIPKKAGDSSSIKMYEKLQEASQLNNSAFQILSLPPSELEKLIAEQETVFKLREKVEGIEKLLCSHLSIDSADAGAADGNRGGGQHGVMKVLTTDQL